MCVCLCLQQRRGGGLVSGCCSTVASRVTRCQTASRTESRAEVWAPPPRIGPVLVPNPDPAPLVGRRRERELTPSRWGTALSTGCMGRVLNLQKQERTHLLKCLKTDIFLFPNKTIPQAVAVNTNLLLYSKTCLFFSVFFSASSPMNSYCQLT